MTQQEISGHAPFSLLEIITKSSPYPGLSGNLANVSIFCNLISRQGLSLLHMKCIYTGKVEQQLMSLLE